jgi:hypothetical protein
VAVVRRRVRLGRGPEEDEETEPGPAGVKAWRSMGGRELGVSGRCHGAPDMAESGELVRLRPIIGVPARDGAAAASARTTRVQMCRQVCSDRYGPGASSALPSWPGPSAAEVEATR